MPNNQFKRRELYFVITGVANMALARRLQKYFRENGLDITVEQWSVLVHLWKYDGVSQQELSTRTFRDKPSITRLVDNLEKLELVQRQASDSDRRINRIYLTEKGLALRDPTMDLANQTLNEGLEGISKDDIEITKRVLEQVYENLHGVVDEMETRSRE
ncbi:MAG TPA: MarR family transcriptional regulator [Phnomibacter sp.]|nr:MarR family transcriptional regulator [Phnomibacter sp.]